MLDNILSEPSKALIKSVAKLKQAKFREQEQKLLVEGHNAIEEALKAGLCGKTLFVAFDKVAQFETLIRQFYKNKAHVYGVDEQVLKQIVTTTTPVKLVAVFQQPEDYTLKDVQPDNGPLLILDRLQDPGNVGTLIRSAKAFGFAGVITTKETAALFSPKVIRSSTGLVFSFPVIASDLPLEELLQQYADTIAYITTAHQSANPQLYTMVKFKPDSFLVLSNEGQGVDLAVLNQSKIQAVLVPMVTGVESLNVSVCGSVMMAEIARQLNLISNE